MNPQAITLDALDDLRRDRDKLADEMNRRAPWNRCGAWWTDRLDLLARIDRQIMDTIQLLNA